MLQLERISLLPDALIHFVHLLELSLAHAVVFETLLADQQLRSKFSKIGERENFQVADAIRWELCDEHHGTDNANSIPTDWIYKLVSQAREKEPIVELQKMMKFEPNVFDGYFVINPLPVKCTAKLTEEARSKYYQLVSKMHSEYKDAVKEKRKLEVCDQKLVFAAAAATTASRLKRKFVTTDGISKGGK